MVPDVLEMLSADINMLIDLLISSFNLGMLVAKGILSPGIEIGWNPLRVTANKIIRSHNTGSHVVDAPLWNGAVENCEGQVGAPK